jgi:photosystem II stability/assembly factor-like uncharacterized protein
VAVLLQVIRTVLSAWLMTATFSALVFASADIVKKERHWDFAGWYGGGVFTNVLYTDAHSVVLASDVAGLWTSYDDGLNWEQKNAGIDDLRISTLSCAPSDTRVLYAGSETGIFRSIDAGHKWTACDNARNNIRFRRPDNYRSIAVSPHDSSMLAVGTADGGVYISEDAGTNWRSLGVIAGVEYPASVSAVFFNDAADELYAALGSALYAYSLRGSVWKVCFNAEQTINDAGKSDFGDYSCVYCAAGNHIFISRDSGDSWMRTREMPRGVAWRIVMFSAEELLVAWKEGWKGGLFRSCDGGNNWLAIERISYDKQRNPTRKWKRGNERVFAINVAPAGDAVMMTTDWGVFFSSDHGITWEERINGAANIVGSDILIAENGTVFAASMDNGLLYSMDGGKTYDCAFPKSGYRPDINGHVWRVAICPDDPEYVIATSSPWNERVNQVIVSTDGGCSFTVFRTGLPAMRPRINTIWDEGYARALAIDPVNPDIVYLGIDGDDGGGLYMSRDRGRRWMAAPIQPPSRRIYNGLVVDPTDSDRLYWGACGDKGGLFISDARDVPWTRADLAVRNVFDVSVDCEGVVYVAGECQGPVVYRSVDRGLNWKPLVRLPGAGTAEAIWINPDDPSVICVSTVYWHGSSGGRIWMSCDRGESWFDISGDISPGSGAAAISYSRSENSIYMILYNGSVLKSRIS